MNAYSPTAALIKLFNERQIPYLVKWADDDPNRLPGLVWVFPYCLQMWKRFPEVISFDNTYNTNRFKLPLFQATGQTCLGSAFNAAFGLRDNERHVIIIDFDDQMKAALDDQFPEVQQQLCIHHINSNVPFRSKQMWVTNRPTYEEQDRDAKKRKRDEPVHNQEQSLQESPFAPKGKFKTHQSMNVIYDIEPRKAWYGMTRFNSFKYHGVKYYVGDHIYVMNDITIKRQNAVRTDSRQQGSLQLTDYWVAKILEIRGSDVEHVYARVFWMYLPDELPPNTLLEGKYVSGRQPYHGQHELIASNHIVDIINVISVAMPATVNQWLESADDREQRALYWRQAFNCLTPELSVRFPKAHL
ncbi:ebs-bah-phd domain-containing protein [Purpureocillium lavendulum]|uniref:Ebs-bah-phd domain-containing protein n=1 Tax=Purpureocillium lavendulum TaxID=1247861 RepID=A0AB34FJ86_9HYPO|nr:ebs-bah-phd domain-containing protein [Purpureocillium lavendulum]